MTAAERSELAAMHSELLASIVALDEKVDCIERRLDRWDGAITLIKAAAGFLGLGGVGLILTVLSQAGH